MKFLCAAAALFSVAVVSFGAAGDYQPPREGFDFPIHTNQPPRNMLLNDSVRRAASTPALAPEETRELVQLRCQARVDEELLHRLEREMDLDEARLKR